MYTHTHVYKGACGFYYGRDFANFMSLRKITLALFYHKYQNTLKKSQKTEKTEAKRKYDAYIKSKDFKAIREKVFERDHYRCACCGYSPFEDKEFPNRKPRTLQCHHRTYEHLFNEYPDHLEDLVTLCSVCHRAIHRAPSNFVRFKMSD